MAYVVDNLLDAMQQKIANLTVMHGGRRALKLLNKFDKEKVFGVGLEANLKFQTGKHGKRQRGGAGDALASGLASTGIVGKIYARKLQLGIEFEDEDLRKMEGGRKGTYVTLEGEIADSLEGEKSHQERLLFGDGSGCLFRVNDASAGGKATITCDGMPILAIEDDEIQSYDKKDTNTRGGNSQTATRRVVSVDHAAGIVYVDANLVATVDDNQVFALSNNKIDQSTNKYTAYPLGFQAHLCVSGDDTAAAADIHDGGAASGFRAVKTYNNLDRTAAANRKMVSGGKDAGGEAVSQYLLSYGPSVLQGMGVPEDNMLLMMSTKQYNRTVEYYAGLMKTIGPTEITVPGGKLRLPVVTAGGFAQLPIFATPWLKDGMIVTIVLGDYEQITSVGGNGWVGDRGKRLRLKPNSSADGFKHIWVAYMVHYWQTTCLKPHRQFVLYNLDTTDE